MDTEKIKKTLEGSLREWAERRGFHYASVRSALHRYSGGRKPDGYNRGPSGGTRDILIALSADINAPVCKQVAGFFSTSEGAANE